MTAPIQGPMGRSGNKIPSGYKQYQVSQYTPQQQQLHSGLFDYVSPDSFLARLAQGDQSAFEETEAPAMRQFAGLQGNIASRFSQGGGRHSSGFKNTINSAASNFAQDLASQRMKTRMSALEELMNFSERILGQRPYETGQVKKDRSPSGWGGVAGAGLGGLGGLFLDGPEGAFRGAKLGYDIGSQF